VKKKMANQKAADIEKACRVLHERFPLFLGINDTVSKES